MDSTIARAHRHATNLTRLAGAGSNYTNPGVEAPDHGIGRSRGAWSSNIHHLVDGHSRPLVILVGEGQAGDAPVFGQLMGHLRIPRVGGGRARTRPDRVRGDKAYSSRTIRNHLRRRGIGAVIPQPADQIGRPKRRGSAGGRPPAFDAEDYKGRNVIERGFNAVKQWRRLATRYDKLVVV
ncbi:IS5 family transposase [Aldersonia kunmingensis]|uniref:IS5 family transposase n=1 Tax=Aldersonia kunmingensis TaxID=408066 RepID=UPI001FE10437|nr:IS5 family transposase [Aldersonia kunmingensis]